MSLHGENGPDSRDQHIYFESKDYERVGLLVPYLRPAEAYSADGVIWIPQTEGIIPYVPSAFSDHPELHLSIAHSVMPTEFDGTRSEVYVGDGSFWAVYPDGDEAAILQKLAAVGDTMATLEIVPWSDALTQRVHDQSNEQSRPKTPRRIGAITIAAAILATATAVGVYNNIFQPALPKPKAPTPAASPSYTPASKAIPAPQPTSWATVTSQSPSVTPSTSSNSSPTSTRKPINKSLEISVASWNTYMGIKRDIGQTVVEELANQDLVGLQETKPNFGHLQDIACETCEYGLYPTATDIKKNADIKRNAVVWKKDTLTLLDAASIQTASNSIQDKKGAIYRDVSDRFYSILLFQEKASKEKFYFINTHLPAYVSGKNGEFRKNPTAKSARAIAAYKNHMQLLARDIAKLSNEGIPILVGGDFNVDSRQSQKDPAMPNNTLGALGFKSMYEMTNFRDIDDNTGTHSNGKRLIDNIYIWSGNTQADLTSAKILNNGNPLGWYSSDHRAIVMTGKFKHKEG